MIALISAILWRPSESSRVWLFSIFIVGLLSLLLFLFSHLWVLRSSIAVAFAGGGVLVVYSCLAISTGILGNRIFRPPWRYASLLIAIYGMLVLLQRLKIYWLIHRK
ncbi:MAG: hypothetical protein LAN61_06435 [Acidobacteriia bacterium]|nr:hypothetical protein [Terriglobia bacterium]